MGSKWKTSKIWFSHFVARSILPFLAFTDCALLQTCTAQSRSLQTFAGFWLKIRNMTSLKRHFLKKSLNGFSEIFMVDATLMLTKVLKAWCRYLWPFLAIGKIRQGGVRICPPAGRVLTRAPLGGKYYHPLPYFLDSSKTAADIDAKFSVPYPPSIWRLLSKFQKNPSRIVLRKLRFSDVMFRFFGSKSGKCLKASRMYSFDVKCIKKTPESVKLSAVQNGYLRFLIFLYFDPQNSIFFKS